MVSKPQIRFKGPASLSGEMGIMKPLLDTFTKNSLIAKMNRMAKATQMNAKEGRASEDKKSITIKVSAEIKELIDKERKLSGETISKIIERAVVNLRNADQRQSEYKTNQELHTNQLRKIANDLRQIVYQVDKIATKQATDQFSAPDFVVVGRKHPWQNHPQKDKIYKLVKAMHRVGANLSMIVSGLNIEGIKKSNKEDQWETADVEVIIEEIRQESDYLPPIYTLPDEK